MVKRWWYARKLRRKYHICDKHFKRMEYHEHPASNIIKRDKLVYCCPECFEVIKSNNNFEDERKRLIQYLGGSW